MLKSPKQNWKVKVRMLLKWNACYTLPGRESFTNTELILMDAKGDRIQATIKSQHLGKFGKSVFEDRVYFLQNFYVVENSAKFKFTNHPYRITFHNGSVINQIDNSVVPKSLHRFTSFEDILSEKLDEAYAYDIIAEIVGSSGERQSVSTSQNRRCQLVLRDNKNLTLNCTLWGSYVQQVCSYLNTHSHGPVVMVFMLGKVKEYSGNMQISNSYNSARILLNPSIPEVHDFVKSLGADASSSSCRVAEINTRPSLSYAEYFLHSKNYVAVDALKSFTHACKVAIRAKVSHLDTVRGWCYFGCKKCGKKMEVSEDCSTCALCNTVSPAIIGRRYRLQIVVEDHSGSATLTLFDKEAIELIGVPADELYLKMVEGGDSEGFPEQLDTIVDNEYLFLVKVTENNNNYKNTSYTVLAVEKQLQLCTEALTKEVQSWPQHPLLRNAMQQASGLSHFPSSESETAVVMSILPHSSQLSQSEISSPPKHDEVNETELTMVTPLKRSYSRNVGSVHSISPLSDEPISKLPIGNKHDEVNANEINMVTPLKGTYSSVGSSSSVNLFKKVKKEVVVRKMVLDSPEKRISENI